MNTFKHKSTNQVQKDQIDQDQLKKQEKGGNESLKHKNKTKEIRKINNIETREFLEKLYLRIIKIWFEKHCFTNLHIFK